MVKVNDLKSIRLFEGLQNEQLAKFVDACITRTFAPRESIRFPGFIDDAIYFVISGRIKVSYFSENGQEFIVTILKKGDVFSRHSEAIATALEKTELLLVPTRHFKKILSENPVIAMRLIRELGKILRLLNDVIQDLAFREVSSRLARLLLREAESRGRFAEGNIVIELGLTHEEISNMVGSARQTVTAIFNRMAGRGIISQRRGRITILDREALKQLAGVNT